MPSARLVGLLPRWGVTGPMRVVFDNGWLKVASNRMGDIRFEVRDLDGEPEFIGYVDSGDVDEFIVAMRERTMRR